INGLFLVVSLLDLLFIPKKDKMIFQRVIRHEMERGITYTGKITLQNASSYTVNISLKEAVPPSFQATFPLQGSVEGESATTFTYHVSPSVRGKYCMDKLYVRYWSVLGLWEKQTAKYIEDMVKVIPDLTETKRYLENAQRFLINEVEKIRMYSEGSWVIKGDSKLFVG